MNRPAFKRKGERDSFYVANDQLEVRQRGRRGVIWVPRIGWIRMTESFHWLGRILSARVFRKADRWYVAIVVETRTALANLDAIIATPGIDGLFLGPSDLSIALSDGRALDPLSKEVDGEIDRIIAAARKVGKIPGAYCHSADRAVALAKRGMRFLAISSDMAFLRAGAAAQLKVLKGA